MELVNKYLIIEIGSTDNIIIAGILNIHPEEISLIGTGRSGSVYAIHGYQITPISSIHFSSTDETQSLYAAKFWHNVPITDNLTAKLRYMVRNKHTYTSNKNIIWPEYLLLSIPMRIDEQGSLDNLYNHLASQDCMVVGYMMPRVRGAFPLNQLIDPGERALLPLHTKDMRFLYHVAMNLSRAFFALHQQGHVMGDAHPRNILFNQLGEIVLIDCDSFQIRRNHFEYYAAERYSSHPGDVTEISQSNDLVSMAQLIFQLLMQGVNPFIGKAPDGSIGNSLRSQRIFSFIHPTYKPLDSAPTIKCLPKTIQLMFLDTFTNRPHNPPDSVEWVKTLKRYSSQLVQCEIDPKHYHLIDHPCAECEWVSTQNTSTDIHN